MLHVDIIKSYLLLKPIFLKKSKLHIVVGQVSLEVRALEISANNTDVDKLNFVKELAALEPCLVTKLDDLEWHIYFFLLQNTIL